MAKKQIKDFKFVPGAIPPAYNAYPNTVNLITANKDYIIAEVMEYLQVASGTPSSPPAAYPNTIALLTNNKNFIKEEATAWIANQVASNTAPFVGYIYDATKCKRDIGYLVDAWLIDLAGGGNAETIRIGRQYWLNGDPQLLNPTQEAAVYSFIKNLATNYIFTKTVWTTLQSPVVATQNTSGTAAEAGGITRFQTLIDIVVYLITDGLSGLTSIVSNYNSLYVGYTYDETKCSRDTEYVIDSYIYDLTYGGNSSTYYTASRYQILGVIQVNNYQVEVQTQTFVRDLITNYILLNKYHANYQLAEEQVTTNNNGEAAGVTQVTTLANIVIDTIDDGLSALPTAVVPNSQNGGLMPNAISLLESNKRFIQEEAIAYIQYNVDNDISPYVYYTYNSEKCKRDVSYILEGYITDLKHGGNRQTVFNASKYWENGVPQVDGSRDPEIYAHTFIRDLIDNYIWSNASFSPYQTAISQVIDNNITVETFAPTRLKELSNTILDVIESGVTYLPAVLSNRGYVKIPGFYKLKDFLLITNTSRNQIMYSFADPASAAEVTYSENYDSDFPGALYGTDKITTITFDVDTSNMMVTDNIQIFVEKAEQTVRLNPIATDAMERMKVGIPQSMLDADFEYGLQPTKWQALSLMRNYPSLYEIPGSDISVTNVTTDASTATGGVGSSLITVTTLSSHGLSVGSPFTIKALANSISGFGRAEGSFLISEVSDTNSFKFYAKSKVGTSNGQVLASTYTQLRRAGYYTGAGVGSATFSVYSAGSTGTMTTNLITASGNDFIGFTGTPAPIGAPLTGSGIVSGTQVTAVTGPGGTAASTTLTTLANIGDATLVVDTTTDISPGLIFDRGDGVGVLITDVTGNTVSLSGALTSAIIGSSATYTGLTQDATSGTGSGAVFTVSRSGGIYSVSSTNPGTGYTASDTVTIVGANLEGTTPANNATITVVSADPKNLVSSLNNSSLVGGTGYSDASGVATTASASGTGLTVNIVTDGLGVITSVTPLAPGQNYSLGETITITGGGGNATIQVSSLTPGGQITSVSVAGTVVTPPSKNFISAITINTPTSAQIASASSITYSAIATIQVTFASNHGFVPGDSITVSISSSGTNAQLAAGAYYVEQTPTPTTIRYTARAAGSIVNTLTGVVYARPDSYFVHRPFDGGVQLGTGGPAHGSTAIRMSKKYIRYQSGKGVMYNTGALFAPSYDLRSLTAAATSVGSVVTVVTDDTDHGCQVGAQVAISGVSTSGFNGVYTVSDIVDERTFRFLANKVLGATSAVLSSQCQMSVKNWHGATVRAGIFDDQNGMFWQYDGIRMAVGRRSSTFQIAGTVNIAANNNLVTGTNTRFTQQLAAGDRIVIKGMSHVVTVISSDTSLTVAPDFRGVADVANVKVCKTVDILVPQEAWNQDQLNGSGPSGYNIDVTKMQMIGIQHTWYGAGFIDFMLRGSEGNYTFAHRFRNSNVNSEAYMRTGNQPVRYEVINEGTPTRLSAAINSSVTIIPLDSTYWFPDAGTVIIDNELIRYTGRTNTSLTGCTRAATLSQFVAGSQRTFTGGSATSHLVRAGVILVSNTVTPIISHWGSAFMIDGQFDSDRGYIFNYAATALSVTLEKKTAFLIRLAPSVSNATVGDLGERELLNRAQLLLGSISVTSDTPGVDPFQGNAWTSGGTATSGLYYSYVFNTVKNWYLAGGSGTFSSTAPTFTTGVGASGTYGVTLTYAGSTPTAGAIVIEGVLNASNYPTDPTLITWNGLSSQASGGQPSFAQIASGGSVTWGGSNYTTTATVQGQFTNTLTAKSFAASTTSLTATSFSAVTQTASAASFATTTSTTYNSALSNTRTDFLITTAAYDALTTPLAAGDTISATTYITSGQTISSVTRNFITLAATPYTRIVMSAVANALSPAAATNNGANITVTFTSSMAARYNTAISAARSDFLFPQTQYSTAILSNDLLSAVTFITGGQTVSSISPSYTTIAGTVYARIVMSANGTATSVAGTGNNVTVTRTSAATATYGSALNTTRSDFLITDSSYTGTGIAVGDILSIGNSSTFTLSNVTTTGTGGQFACDSTTLFVNMTVRITGTIGGSGSISGYSTGNLYYIVTTNGSTTFTLSATLGGGGITTTAGTPTGLTYTVNSFISGAQTITTITTGYITINSVSHTRIVMSAPANLTSVSGASQDITVTVTATGSAATYTTTSYLFFTSTSWLSSGATVGTRVASSYTGFPAGTSVNAVTTRIFGGTTVYRVSFTQSSTTTIAASATPIFQFGALYALPGETVFSFVSNPGSTDTLSLVELKELTATTIGGRGAFPNGPDVLAINVYKVSGTTATANIILRWGEAQA